MPWKKSALGLVLACGWALGTAFAEESPRIPRREGSITVFSANSAWWLAITTDGSGMLAHGASADLNGYFKKGTFDFAATHKALLGVAKTKGGGEGHHGIHVRQDGKAADIAFATKDSRVVLPLFERAYRAIPAKERRPGFERTWQEYPPGGKGGPEPTEEQPPKR
jgi:hypothetical protein